MRNMFADLISPPEIKINPTACKKIDLLDLPQVKMQGNFGTKPKPTKSPGDKTCAEKKRLEYYRMQKDAYANYEYHCATLFEAFKDQEFMVVEAEEVLPIKMAGVRYVLKKILLDPRFNLIVRMDISLSGRNTHFYRFLIDEKKVARHTNSRDYTERVLSYLKKHRLQKEFLIIDVNRALGYRSNDRYGLKYVRKLIDKGLVVPLGSGEKGLSLGCRLYKLADKKQIKSPCPD